MKMGTKGTPRHTVRKNELVDLARTLFLEKGVQKTTMAEIAKQAGVAEGTLYLYFENKKDLLNEVAISWSAQYLDQVTQELIGCHGLEEKIEAIVRNQLQFMFLQPELYFMFFREIRANPEYPKSKLRTYNKHYTNLFKRAIAPDGSRDPAQAAHINLLRDIVYGSIEHVGWRYLIRGEADQSKIPALSREVTRLLLKIIDRPESADDTHTRLSKIEQMLGISATE